MTAALNRFEPVQRRSAGEIREHVRAKRLRGVLRVVNVTSARGRAIDAPGFDRGKNRYVRAIAPSGSESQMNESETALAALALVGGVGATPDAPRPSKVSSEIELRVSDLAAIVETATHKDDYPYCEDIVKGIPVYDGPKVRDSIKCREQRCEFSHEFIRALSDGPGIVLVRLAWSNLSVLDRVTEAFRQIIDDEALANASIGDHFGSPGQKSRVWNALQKLCIRDPEAYARYYANEILDCVAQSWLGPGYRLTSQVNVVNPGAERQTPHRDYHLGFMSSDRLERFPAHAHRLSPYLTLQAAVAHVDMPLASGPTMFLPYSQRYERGYLAAHLPSFQQYFERRHVQVPLSRGDAVFFNPAVMHAAGKNTSQDIYRMANLMLISSPLGVAMESIDSQKICAALYPELLALLDRGELDAGELDAVISVSADGYAFPTNLEFDPPVEGLSSATQQDILRRAADKRWSGSVLDEQLSALAARRRPL
jgi:ectoine hydroxylase-related dioxygenase (phytanoyl-CoA dioxygenase family)